MQRPEAVRWFLLVFGALAIPVLAAICSMDRFELHRIMHPFHSEALDMFFRISTHLGDGLVPTVIALFLLLFRDLRSFAMVAVSCVLSAVIVQGLKHGPFSAEDRPSSFMEELGDLHWVEGLELHHHFSFPSGHSAAAFSLCFALAVLKGRPAGGAVLAILAAIIAYSRVYLNQHFTLDILVGSAIGVTVAWGTYIVLYQTHLAERTWVGRRLIRTREDRERLG